MQYVNENNVPDITADDIIWCGIMDWGRSPYGAANHAWRPERRYWEIMADLADITVNSNFQARHLHVCGEAYSDYHGFIEGSLRSAVYTLTRILRTPTVETTDLVNGILSVLGKARDSVSGRDGEYLDDLYSWIDNLDSCRHTT